MEYLVYEMYMKFIPWKGGNFWHRISSTFIFSWLFRLSNEDDYDQNENVDTDSTNSETSDNTEGSGAVVEEVPTDNPGSDSDEFDTDEAPVEEEEESSSSDTSTDDDNKDDSSSTAAKRRRKNKNPNRRIGVPFSG